MSKTLLTFRHAKSDWDAGAGDDHSRPLNKRGIRSAKTMGKVLARMGQVPDRVVSSSAVRAKTTIELAVKSGKWKCPVTVSGDLYESSVSEMMQVIHNLPEDADSVLFAGHEPTWSMLLSTLVGGGKLRVPTASVACVDIRVESWSEVTAGAGELLWLLPPRLFTDGDFSTLLDD